MPLRSPPFFRYLATCALLLACALEAVPAHAADDYTEVQRLDAAGEHAQALAKAGAYIAAHPNDPQMRFIQANLLASAGQADEAEKQLEQLTRDYPELAEPWNNLAVLQAARGRLAEARAALENALRIQPDYATALENLGDVQARLALQAYRRAQALDAGNPRLAPKIQTLDPLWGAAAKP